MLLMSSASVSVATAAPPPDPDGRAGPSGSGQVPPQIHPHAIEPGKRGSVLGQGWQTSQDRIWTTTGDAAGFHVLVAEAQTGYAWRTAVTLSQDGVDTDRWIGNACLTASGRRAVVVYAPRTFTNRENLFDRGGFTAVVDLVSGAVTKLPVRTSLAYFNPGCGNGENAVLTQGADQDLGKTGLLNLNAETGVLDRRIEIPGQLTSAVPTGNGIVAADKDAVVRVTTDGKRTVLAKTTGVPFLLTPDASGGVVFMDRGTSETTVRVRRAASVVPYRPATSTLASGSIDRLAVATGAAGKVFITGQPDKVGALPASVVRLDVPSTAEVSSLGEAVITAVAPVDHQDPGLAVDDPNDPRLVNVTARSMKTGQTMEFTVDPADVLTPRSAPTDDPGRYCSVPRNDPRTQVYQPKPKQVEWAADMAVKGHLFVNRPADWKHNGLPSYTPQGLFEPIPLMNTNGGQVPAQILLGILGQESNLWQASRLVYPGQTGNPLVGNYYGRDIYNDTEADDWDIRWEKSDCGYGVTQMTDGMRLAGHEKENEVALPWLKQKAIATDYAANVAAGLQLLQRKWNQLQEENVTVNNNDPSKLENWFFAIWAYNSGWHYPGEPASAGAWGLGWFNNPANPKYSPTRATFGFNPRDYAQPQKWPYPEKVLGFAGNPPSAFEAPGVSVPLFRAAWWNGDASTSHNNKWNMRPGVNAMCTAANQCEPFHEYVPDYPGDATGKGDVRGEPAGPCAHRNGVYYDLKCWWHDPVTWKSDCNFSCGNEFIRYDWPEYAAEPADGTSFRPKCGFGDLPAGTQLIDDLADDVPPVSVPFCSRLANAGSFSMEFGRDSQGREASKIDLHQSGGGFGAHFWFSHTNRDDDIGRKLKITGTWSFNRTVNGWARVLVHIPDHGAHTRQAKYTIDLGNGGSRYRVLPQRIRANTWVSLGAFPFGGLPKVSLSNIAGDGRNAEDVAWDAAAVVPLPAKPRNIIAALGDSYASGEGASGTGGTDYYKVSDVDGRDAAWRNACHRSTRSWSRVMTLADSTIGVGARSDSYDPDVEYHMVACSGARTRNLLPSDGSTDAWGNPYSWGYNEVSQLDSGYVDQDTTLVTLSIGGNDARFVKIVQKCIEPWVLTVCQNSTLDGDPEPLKDYEPKVISNEVRRSVEIVLDKIHQRAPSAKILLMGYPQIFSRDGQCIPFIGTEEAPWLNSMGAKMNEQLALAAQNSAAKGMQIKFSDPTADFNDKSVCGDPELIHGIVTALTPGDDPEFEYWPGEGFVSAQGFHPKIEGATKYAEVAARTLREFGL